MLHKMQSSFFWMWDIVIYFFFIDLNFHLLSGQVAHSADCNITGFSYAEKATNKYWQNGIGVIAAYYFPVVAKCFDCSGFSTHRSATTLKPPTGDVNNIDHFITMQVLLGNFGSWHSWGCYFDMDHQPKHCCRLSTPLMATPTAVASSSSTLWSTAPQKLLRKSLRNTTKIWTPWNTKGTHIIFDWMVTRKWLQHQQSYLKSGSLIFLAMAGWVWHFI